MPQVLVKMGKKIGYNLTQFIFAGIDPTLVQDICVGNVQQGGAGAATSRMAQFYSGMYKYVVVCWPSGVIKWAC